MIRVVIKRNSEGNIVEFNVKGHADYAEHGQDVVCAAVSALAISSVLGIQEYVKVDCPGKMSHGKFDCKIPSDISSEKRMQVNAILETMFLGIKKFRGEYSSYIKLKEEEV